MQKIPTSVKLTNVSPLNWSKHKCNVQKSDDDYDDGYDDEDDDDDDYYDDYYDDDDDDGAALK